MARDTERECSDDRNSGIARQAGRLKKLATEDKRTLVRICAWSKMYCKRRARRADFKAEVNSRRGMSVQPQSVNRRATLTLHGRGPHSFQNQGISDDYRQRAPFGVA